MGSTIDRDSDGGISDRDGHDDRNYGGGGYQPKPSWDARLDAYFSPRTAAEFSIGFLIGGLLVGSVKPWDFIVSGFVAGIGLAVFQTEGRLLEKRKIKKRVHDLVTSHFRREVSRNIDHSEPRSGLSRGEKVGSFSHRGVNESRLCPRKVTDKICDKLGITKKKTREAVWQACQAEAYKPCRRWNKQKRYLQKRV